MAVLSREKTARNRQKCLIPPPPPRDGGGETPAGLEIAFELDDDLGLVLWSSLKLAHSRLLDFRDGDSIWSEAPPEVGRAGAPSIERIALWRSARTYAPDLGPALDVFSQLRELPLDVDAATLATACQSVRVWAEATEHPQVAAYFAEAAAYAAGPADPSAAITAARSCRNVVLYKRAAQWYHSGKSSAVRAGAKSEVVRALLGYGGLMYHLGYHARARHLLTTAKTRAENWGRQRQAAEAEHDLLLLAGEERNYALGESHAQEALRLYPLSNPRIPYLVHDIAHFFVNLRLYAPAIPLLKGVTEKLPRSSDQALVWSTVALAAAGAGRTALYDEAVSRVKLVDPTSEFAAAVYRSLAYAAWLRGNWCEADSLASLTISAARSRGERQPLRAGRWLRAKLAAKEPAPPPADPPGRNMIDAIQRRCLTALRAWRPRPPKSSG